MKKIMAALLLISMILGVSVLPGNLSGEQETFQTKAVTDPGGGR